MRPTRCRPYSAKRCSTPGRASSSCCPPCPTNSPRAPSPASADATRSASTASPGICPAATATVTLTSTVTQAITLISRRGIASITTSATVTSSPLGSHARVISLTAGQQIQVTVGLPTGRRQPASSGWSTGAAARCWTSTAAPPPTGRPSSSGRGPARPTSSGGCCPTPTAHSGCPASAAARSWTARVAPARARRLSSGPTTADEPVVESRPRDDQRILPAGQREQRLVCRRRRRLHRRRRQGRPATGQRRDQPGVADP